jgi:hypothetical protein
MKKNNATPYQPLIPRNICNILIQKSQQDGHFTEFILSDDCSTCFRYHYHPSSGAQTIVTTASGNRYTVLLSVAIMEELELI